MGLESATYIHELDPTNPIGASDPKSQGDDHLRMIKGAIKSSLPNVTGIVSATHTDLNKTSALSSGTYTPTFSSLTNLNTVTAQGLWQWMRIGNIVSVIGRFLPGAITASPSFRATLPVARGVNFNTANLARGSTIGRNDANSATSHGTVDSVNATELILVTAYPGAGWGNNQEIVFSYSIIN